MNDPFATACSLQGTVSFLWFSSLIAVCNSAEIHKIMSHPLSFNTKLTTVTLSSLIPHPSSLIPHPSSLILPEEW